MVAVALIDGAEVQMNLERRTAGMGAHARAEISEGEVRSRGIWEWCASASGHGAWTKYSNFLTSKLEEAFQAGRVQADLDIGDSLYSVDLELMVQVNCRTSYRRLVRR